jgi:hypothetical protein
MSWKIDHEERRAAVTDAIRAHRAEFGDKNWSRVIDQFPEVSDGTFWRCVRAVREESKLEPEVLAGAIEKAKRAVSAYLPAPVPPEYYVRGGVTAVRNVDFLTTVSRLHTDIDMIRNWAVTVAEDGEEKIKNPNFFVQAVKLRMELQRVQVQTAEKVYQMQQSREYWDTIIEEIGKESKECQHRIVQRIAVLNARRGMTIHAGEVEVPPAEFEQAVAQSLGA